MTEPMSLPASGEHPAPGLARGGRLSRRRKLSAVLRLLRGEDLELVSRELGVTAARLPAGGATSWPAARPLWSRASATIATCRSRGCGPRSAS